MGGAGPIQPSLFISVVTFAEAAKEGQAVEAGQQNIVLSFSRSSRFARDQQICLTRTSLQPRMTIAKPAYFTCDHSLTSLSIWVLISSTGFWGLPPLTGEGFAGMAL